MPIVTIDDQSLEVEPGTLTIQAADRGTTLLYHPDVCPESNCRMSGAEFPIDRGKPS